MDFILLLLAVAKWCWSSHRALVWQFIANWCYRVSGSYLVSHHQMLISTVDFHLQLERITVLRSHLENTSYFKNIVEVKVKQLQVKYLIRKAII